jgi:hypothetical protein
MRGPRLWQAEKNAWHEMATDAGSIIVDHYHELPAFVSDFAWVSEPVHEKLLIKFPCSSSLPVPKHCTVSSQQLPARIDNFGPMR